MTVIPFNPGGAGGDARALKKDPPDGGALGAGEAGDEAASQADTAQAARLEHALIAALRENAANWARAERAEQMLGERQATPPGDPA